MVESDAPGPDDVARDTVAGWFDRHVDTIHRYVARRAGDDVALDVTAETFRVALEQFERFDSSRGGERAWLYGIATNLLRRHWRAEYRRMRVQRRVAGHAGVAGDPLLAVDGRVDAESDARRVLGAIELLDPEDRDLLVLVAWEHLSSVEIAHALGIPASTIRARLRRIRSVLQADQGAST
jgi:RNA polymerase sigma factor (sigma-70 family)